jgi:hypothetical protein
MGSEVSRPFHMLAVDAMSHELKCASRRARVALRARGGALRERWGAGEVAGETRHGGRVCSGAERRAGAAA